MSSRFCAVAIVILLDLPYGIENIRVASNMMS
jgi:hypothetical protein